LAEKFLQSRATLELKELEAKDFDIKLLNIDEFINVNQTTLAINYASKEDLKSFASRGVLTPEHIIRTKRVPLVLENSNVKGALKTFAMEYEEYFNEFSKDEIILNKKPKYAVIKDFGVVSFGKTQKEADIINDIVSHTMKAVMQADMLGGYKSISKADSFAMEYWELEQAKLKK
jgi:rhamnose utilization protein RhaD (predicted bifunctional aldolase and dehydrogenase)